MSRLLTGIKPTGDIHIGNYFGVMQPLVQMQEEYECFVFVADLHALNQIHDAELLKELTREIVTAYLAVGLDPEKVVLFRQSQVSAHAEATVIFNSITSMGLLERSHAYKDALANGKQPNAGLFTYPVLMAADILLYKPDVVPVGKDQQQHVEYMADIAGRFNHLFGDTFEIPQGLIGEESGYILGLDGRKMSKSYDNVIGLFDSPENTIKKVMKIVTDSKGPGEAKDPSSCNVFYFHKLFSQDQLEEIEQRYQKGDISYKESKDILAKNVNDFLAPIREKKQQLDSNTSSVEDILQVGQKKAEVVASQTLLEIKKKVGLL